jgi:phospholipid/cholesterol/gamma-HCH transport system permease protein
MVSGIGQAAAFFARTGRHLPGTLVRPTNWLGHFYSALIGVLPLALAAGIAMGLVAWIHLHGLLTPYQSEAALPRVLLLTVVWEFGPIAVAFVAAGRLGAGLAAELAALKETEQLDAAQVLGVRIVPRLVAPRVLACMLALPVLTIFVDYVALLSGYGAEAVGGTMTWTEYSRASLEYLRLADVILATLKTCIFGFLIGCCGCYAGLRSSGGAAAVGRASTQGVVRSTMLVLAADILLVKLIQLVVPPM